MRAVVSSRPWRRIASSTRASNCHSARRSARCEFARSSERDVAVSMAPDSTRSCHWENTSRSLSENTTAPGSGVGKPRARQNSLTRTIGVPVRSAMSCAEYSRGPPRSRGT